MNRRGYQVIEKDSGCNHKKNMNNAKYQACNTFKTTKCAHKTFKSIQEIIMSEIFSADSLSVINSPISHLQLIPEPEIKYC